MVSVGRPVQRHCYCGHAGTYTNAIPAQLQARALKADHNFLLYPSQQDKLDNIQSKFSRPTLERSACDCNPPPQLPCCGNPGRF